MGRTVATYRQALETLVKEWQNFRDALCREDRKAFDQLINKARKHSGAASYDAWTDPMDSFFLSILVEQEKEIKKLKGTYGER